MSKKIKIKIDRSGKTHIEVDGCDGAQCEDITRALVQALGSAENVQHKPEYYSVLDDIQQKVYESNE